MNNLKKFLFLSILFFSASGFAAPFTRAELIEQEYGGEMVTFSEMQAFIKQKADCRIMDDGRPAAFLSGGELFITRGMLYQLNNESELDALLKSAAVKEDCEISFQPVENGASSSDFKAVFAPFMEGKEAYLSLARGFKACELGNYEEALCLGERVLAALPEEPHHLRLLATASAGVGNSPGALIELKKALRLNSNYYGYYLQRGMLFYKSGLAEAAKIDLLECLARYPSELAYLYLGKIALLEGHNEEAMRYFDLSPNQPETANYRVMAKVMASLSDRVEQISNSA